jgi:uncharacterized protein (TIGR00730 family)
VYCGSSPGNDAAFLAAARETGAAIVERGCELVYGGADVGLMGELANSVLGCGGRVTGVIPRAFANRVSHSSLTELRVVESMHERKKVMFELSDAFVALPGGFGTLEEILEVVTWTHLGMHAKPCGLLNVSGYYDGLGSFFDDAVSAGLISADQRSTLMVADDARELLSMFDAHKPMGVMKWEGLERKS